MRQMIVTATLLLALSGGAMADPVYKWVDERGVTHFSATPPDGQPVSTINPKIPAAKPTDVKSVAPSQDNEQAAIDKKVKAQVAEENSQHKAYCERTRTNLSQLQNNPRLRVEEDGEVRRIDEDERQRRITDLKKEISENC